MIDYCTDGSVWARTGCILSYSGSTKDIILNYIMLVINLVWCVIALSLHTKDNMDQSAAALRNFAIGALVFVFFFQITLCLLVHCTGISILWCAMGGYIISERKRLKQTSDDDDLSRRVSLSLRMEQLVILLDVGVILYYTFVAVPITTVAHLCAIVLGATLSLMSIRLLDDPEVEASADYNSLEEETVEPSTTLLLDRQVS